MVIAVVRWIALGLSLLGLGMASYSLWLSACQNRRLILKNHELAMENMAVRVKNRELQTMCDSYWEEIVQLRERVYDGEENQLQEVVETPH